jgi:hypothetical protein
MYLALYEHQPDAAHKALADEKAGELVGNVGYPLPRSFYEGLIARASGNAAQSRTSFAAARAAMEAKLGGRHDDALAVATLGIIEAGLGSKEEASAFGRRAVELQPIANDAVDGPTVLTALAMIYAWSGEPNLAIEQLTALSRIPGGPDYGQLRYDPAWDALRGDKRFDEIVETAKHFRQQ